MMRNAKAKARFEEDTFQKSERLRLEVPRMCAFTKALVVGFDWRLSTGPALWQSKVDTSQEEE